MDDDLISTIENIFITVAKIDFCPFYKKSLTLVVNGLRAKSIRERDITDFLDFLLSKAASYKAEALDELGIQNPTERLRAAVLLEEINLDKLKEVLVKDPADAVKQVNGVFQKNALTSRIEISRSNNIITAVKKIKYSNNADYNIKLILSRGLVEEVLPYQGRYGESSLEVLQRCVNEAATIRADLVTPATDTDALNKKLVEFLKNVGHTNLSLTNKSMDELSRLVVHHYFALKALLRARQEGIKTISRDLLADYVALEIVRESETG